MQTGPFLAPAGPEAKGMCGALTLNARTFMRDKSSVSSSLLSPSASSENPTFYTEATYCTPSQVITCLLRPGSTGELHRQHMLNPMPGSTLSVADGGGEGRGYVINHCLGTEPHALRTTRNHRQTG
ncbi:hypothetical protein C0Q70_18063 [Pomacea canaliculata]|uniref:Uncharacterized protein n=1 Tax=Pomacea canaliculata TaxID=400727 RepID=A0A2T7NM63_POMCA|nr:hypothetical protein C0Q70_18063 [Pomacea canaliculata]